LQVPSPSERPAKISRNGHTTAWKGFQEASWRKVATVSIRSSSSSRSLLRCRGGREVRRGGSPAARVLQGRAIVLTRFKRFMRSCQGERRSCSRATRPAWRTGSEQPATIGQLRPRASSRSRRPRVLFGRASSSSPSRLQDPNCFCCRPGAGGGAGPRPHRGGGAVRRSRSCSSAGWASRARRGSPPVPVGVAGALAVRFAHAATGLPAAAAPRWRGPPVVGANRLLAREALARPPSKVSRCRRVSLSSRSALQVGACSPFQRRCLPTPLARRLAERCEARLFKGSAARRWPCRRVWSAPQARFGSG